MDSLDSLDSLDSKEMRARRLALLARVLACLGAVVFAVSGWLPWTIMGIRPPEFRATLYFGISANDVPGLIYLTRASSSDERAAHLLPFLPFVWPALAFLSVLLALTLWQSGRSRLFIASLWLFRLWCVLATLLAAVLVLFLFGGGLVSLLGYRASAISERGTALGLPVAVAGLALLWTSLVLARRSTFYWAESSSVGALPWRMRVRVSEASLLTAGILLWLIGFITIPWASVNCSSFRLSLNHFVDGHCAGLDAGDTLVAAVAPHLSTGIGYFAQYMLLLAYGLPMGAALILTIAVWRGSTSRGFHLLRLSWLVLVTIIAAVAFVGIARVIATAPRLSFDAVGDWHADYGALVTLVGLLLAWGSIAAPTMARRKAAL